MSDLSGSAEKEHAPERRQSLLPLFLIEALIFSGIVALGIATSLRLQETIADAGAYVEPVPAWKFIVAVGLGTILILGIIAARRFKKVKSISFKAFFAVASFVGSMLFFTIWISPLAALVLSSLLVAWWLKRRNVFNHNVALAVGIIGLGTALGVRLEPSAIVLLLPVFAVYDYIAVYKTKHMVRMAKEMMRSQAVMGFIIPQHLADLQNGSGRDPSRKYIVVGSGDAVFPLIFIGVVASGGMFPALFMGAFSILGFFLAFFLLMRQRTRRPIPALPPIALLLLVGYLILSYAGT